MMPLSHFSAADCPNSKENLGKKELKHAATEKEDRPLLE
jgi:hypothetical protein